MGDSANKRNQRAAARRTGPPATSETILEAVPDMMFRLDREGRYLEFKPAKGVEPFVPPDEFLGRRIQEILPQPVADVAMATVDEVFLTGEPRTFDYELLEEAGFRRYEARIVPFGDDSVLAIVRDVTDAAGHAKTERPDVGLTGNRQEIEKMPEMMFRMNREGQYLEFKPAKDVEPFAPPDRFVGRRMHDILPEEIADAGLAIIEDALQSGESQIYLFELPVDDEVHYYEARIVPLGGDDVLAVVRDATVVSEQRSPNGSSRGRYALTPREIAVLRAVAGGHTDKEIGRRLSISPLTVRKHVASIRRKMGALSRTDASVRALREGLLD